MAIGKQCRNRGYPASFLRSRFLDQAIRNVPAMINMGTRHSLKVKIKVVKILVSKENKSSVCVHVLEHTVE